MDLEKLTKHQIILLTLLVSFMTSIATGIVTVSLMNQASPQVTRIINQVVQQTVEKVVPVQQGPITGGTVVKTVVQSDDVVAQSVSAARKGIIRITVKGSDKLIARGIIINSSGMALTDREALIDSGASAFDAILFSGQRVPITIPTGQSSADPILRIAVTVGTSTGFAPAYLADPQKLTLGEGVIRIDGIAADTVSEGVIAMIPSSSSSNSPTEVEASMTSQTPGSVLLSLFGDVIALSTTVSQAQGSDFYSVPTTTLSVATTTPAAKSSL